MPAEIIARRIRKSPLQFKMKRRLIDDFALFGSPSEPVSSEQHCAGLLRRGSHCCAVATPAFARSASHSIRRCALALLTLASRHPSASSSPAAIVWSTVGVVTCACLVPGWPHRVFRSAWRVTEHAFALTRPGCRARFRRCRPHRTLSSGLTRTRACSTSLLKRIPIGRSRGHREIPRLSAGNHPDPHDQVSCRQCRAQRADVVHKA